MTDLEKDVRDICGEPGRADRVWATVRGLGSSHRKIYAREYLRWLANWRADCPKPSRIKGANMLRLEVGRAWKGDGAAECGMRSAECGVPAKKEEGGRPKAESSPERARHSPHPHRRSRVPDNQFSFGF